MSERDAAVGVVIAVRNAVPHLGRALGSVLAQDPAPVDVVVVDGGCGDGSASIVRAFQGARLVEQNGKGLGDARNQGVQTVAGDLVAFCDADDRWSKNALAARLAAFDRCSEAMAVIGRVVFEEVEGSVPSCAQRERLGQMVAGFTPGALLARREVFDLIGPFDEGLTIGCDADWFVRLQQSRMPWMQIGDVALYKGVRGDSLSSDVVRYRRELLTIARRFVERRRAQADT